MRRYAFDSTYDFPSLAELSCVAAGQRLEPGPNVLHAAG